MPTTKRKDSKRTKQPSIEIDREKKQHNFHSYKIQKKTSMTTEGIMVPYSQRAARITSFPNFQQGEDLYLPTFPRLL